MHSPAGIEPIIEFFSFLFQIYSYHYCHYSVQYSHHNQMYHFPSTVFLVQKKYWVYIS
jgi:hypothetical protein